MSARHRSSPYSFGHQIQSTLDAEATALFDNPVDKVSEQYEIMRFDGRGDMTHLTCGVVRFDPIAGQRQVNLLPRVLMMNTWNSDDDIWLQSILRFIAKEAKEMKPGGETVITHLADILIIQAIRS